MKKLILTAVAAGVVGFGVQSARAGHQEWATVGKVLTGVAAGVVIAKAMDGSPGYASVSYSSYGYASPAYSVSYAVGAPAPCAPPPVVYAPAPVVYAPAPVVVYRPPVVCAPPPVVCAPAPAYYAHPGRGHGHGKGHWKH
jgi:hypothetical protein